MALGNSADLLMSDSQLQALAIAELQSSPYPEVRRAKCRVQGDVMTLTGSVRSFYQKQLAQSQLLARWEGQIVLDNQLQVTSGQLHVTDRQIHVADDRRHGSDS